MKSNLRSVSRILNIVVMLMMVFSQFGWAVEKASADQSNQALPLGLVTVNITPENQWIQANGWTSDWSAGTLISLDIDDPQTSQLSDYTATAVIGPAPWDQNANVAFFDLNDNFTLREGDIATVAGGTTSVVITITNFRVTGMDAGTDTISGWATPGAGVNVCANTSNGCEWRRVQADDTTGFWAANYAILGLQSDEQQIVNINPGDNGFALEYSHTTVGLLQYNWAVPGGGNPSLPHGLVNVSVTPGWQWVQANSWINEWAAGTDIFLTIDDPHTVQPVDYTATLTMGPSFWDSNLIVAFFELNDQYLLETGDILTITGGTTSISVTISGFRVTGMDAGTDTISGWATPGADVGVCACTSIQCEWRHVQADITTGDWSADYSVPGTRSEEQQTLDINPGDNGFALEYSQTTAGTLQYDWKLPGTNSVISNSGGTLSAENNMVALSIPAGAIPDSTTFSITDGGSGYEIASSQGTMQVVNSYSIQPHGTTFNSPASITFHWDDANNDGIVDGTALLEASLQVIKDGLSITQACGVNPNCDMNANLLTIQISSLSVFELAALLDSDGDGLTDIVDACPYQNPNGRDADQDGCTDTATGLVTLIQNMPASQMANNIKNSLLAKVGNAIKSMEKGKDATAINQLQAFINEVQAQRGKKITSQTANLLIAYARNVMAGIP